MIFVRAIATVLRIQDRRILEEASGRCLKYFNLIEQLILIAKVRVVVAMKVVIIIKAKRKIIFQSRHQHIFHLLINQILVNA